MSKQLKIIFTGLLALLALNTALAEDKVTGTWNSSFKTPRGPMEMSFVLEFKGDNKLEGFWVNPISGQVEIEEGSSNGTEVSFKIFQRGPFGPMILCFDGHVEGDLLVLVTTYEGSNAPDTEDIYEATRE